MASGQGWLEVDDAPEFPSGCGQPVAGTGLAASITGSTSTAEGDYVDAYLIDIVEPEAFFATTSAATDASIQTSASPGPRAANRSTAGATITITQTRRSSCFPFTAFCRPRTAA